MGYDLHITRRAEWFDTGNDISQADFLVYLRTDPEFTYPSSLGANYADWKGPGGDDHSWLCWREGQIETKNPEPVFVDKMVAVAKALEAKVQGDEGEIYESSADLEG